MEHIVKKSKFLDLFIEVTQTITSCLDLDEVFDLIPKNLVKTLDIDAATIRLIDSSREKLILKAAYGLSDDYLNRGAIDTEEPVFKALQGEPIFIENAVEDSRIVYHEETKKEGINSILVVPISIRGRVEGVLRLLTKKPYKFDQHDIDFVSALAKQCGIAIENARFVHDQKIWLNYFVIIHQISKLINSTSDLNEILEIIVTRLPETMELKAATIRFFEKKGKLELKAAHGLSNEYLARGSLDKEAATYYLMEGEPIVILDAQKDIHTVYHKEAEAEGIRSVLAVPISFREDVIGILRLLSSDIRNFSAADINFAMAIADQTGIAIQRVL
ncbi:MAG: GAF domain-containing protein [Desulfobacula sp.]|jgi:GAF domain-containing protein|uniref:GAF domain-containing protein n=2 Tax=Desulfobacula sp. TaxID=2593537 RepID=UPI001EB92DC0|nr:GAF domain-containing protein [Desulfobacula sp.]MBT4876156.1 GAF domain-containing protein [Desulfobacula sp.]MBT5547256.1 GAF domain-containing protein [Desulfobacula sp.]MBT7630044.1 GAF domain-containing protein [Desulfobacula sp.]MBT7793006.1 GAF domain-containing protein [Desulfobacula sp.]